MASLTIDALRKEYRSGIEGTKDGRTEGLKARDYYDGRQYTAQELEIYRKRKQPPIVYNRVRKKVNGLVGYEITRRTDPVAYGRTQKDMKAAATATKLMRYVEESNRLDAAITRAFAYALVEGVGTVEVTVKPKNPDYEVLIRAIAWEMVYYDPRSREPDFSDAGYKGISEWMSLDEAQTRYKDEYAKNPELFQFDVDGNDGFDEHESMEDRPRNSWFDETRKRIRIVQHWRKERGNWYYYIFTGNGIIDKGLSPYKNDEDQTICPQHMFSPYVDKENNRHGIVRDLFGPQDEINHRRSKLLHKLSEKQFFYSPGSIEDPERTRNELKKPDGVIEVNQGVFGKEFGVIEDNTGLQGQAELLAEAKMEIDTQGINPALIGRDTGAASGRAILATQQGAIAEEAIVFDRLREFKLGVYRAVWYAIKQFYRAERVIRITDDRKAPEYVSFNKVVGQTPDGKNIVNNPVAMMDIDLIIEETQDSPTLQAEEFEKITQLMAEVPGFAQEVDMIDVLKASSLTNKHEWIERIEKKREEAANQPPNPMQEMAVKVEMGKAKAEIDEKTASANLKNAQTDKTRAEIGQTAANTNKTAIEAEILPFQAAHGAAMAEMPKTPA